MEDQSRRKMSATHLRIKNLKTEEVYTTTAEGWQTIVNKGMASRFEVVEELRPATTRDTKIPQAIADAAKAAAEEETNGTKGAKPAK